LVQIKSHAQKVLKRIVGGENVFRKLEENCTRLRYLLSRLHDEQGEGVAVLVPEQQDPARLTHLACRSTAARSGSINAQQLHQQMSLSPAQMQTLTAAITNPVPSVSNGATDIHTNDIGQRKRSRLDGDETNTTDNIYNTAASTSSTKKRNGSTDLIAASALCQLAGPEGEGNNNNGGSNNNCSAATGDVTAAVSTNKNGESLATINHHTMQYAPL
jgi:hypothetical protein